MTSLSPTTRDARTALIQFLVLTVLCLAVFVREIPIVFRQVIANPEAAHVLALPVLAGILLYRRWDEITRRVSRGSVWGLVVIAIALSVLVFASWPFNFGYPRQVALVLAIAGVTLATCGWSALRMTGPILLLLLICVPVGVRVYARLIIAPETYTLAAARAVLDLLPGVTVSLDGPDMFYETDHGAGAIALGEPHRGASLFMAYVAIGIFVTCFRLRPRWQVAAMTVVLVLGAAACNFLRVLIYGVVTIYTRADPLNPMPRYFSIVGSLMLAYGIYVLFLDIMNRVVIEAPTDKGAPVSAPDAA